MTGRGIDGGRRSSKWLDVGGGCPTLTRSNRDLQPHSMVCNRRHKHGVVGESESSHEPRLALWVVRSWPTQLESWLRRSISVNVLPSRPEPPLNLSLFLEPKPSRRPSWLATTWSLPSQRVTMTGAAAGVPVRGGGGGG
ncbi:hypothetical protein CRG98_021610 [Punica granatum]|uniref:Uncharacterized protein n=1 Tax=Punica granatum TaxID=22663 RepID=A0A2I0JQ59_PUNGR|nr:hypothetical protein CRG98_021610 [Punica granatum]